MNRAASTALFKEHVRYLDGDLLKMRNWRAFSLEPSLIDVAFFASSRLPFRVQMNCEDWNELPPAITLLSVDGGFLTVVPRGPTGIFHQGPHPTTKRPFVCMAGSREYHTHPSHIPDSWENYKMRSGYDLGGILTRVWNGWLKSTP